MKTFFLLWGAAFMIITALLYGLQAVMIDWPLWCKTLLLSGLMMVIMQRIVTPVVKKL